MLTQHPRLMAAGTPTLFLTALLCLGLCRGPGYQVQTGTTPKPSIWADPSPRVPMKGSVTIWCRGSQEASGFRLYKERDSEGEFMEESPAHPGQAYIYLQNLNVHRAGQYQCSYSSTHHPEQRSDNLTLVVTGLFPAPLLEAHPSPVVASGGNVSLSCSSPNMTGSFYLLKEGDAEPRHLKPQFFQGRFQASFVLGPVNAAHGGNYRCYLSPQSQPYSWSLPSTPLGLQVTGVTLGPGNLDSLTLLLGLSGALLGLLLLFILVFFHHQHRQDGHQKLIDAAVTHTETVEGAQLNPQMDINNEEPQGVTYSQVNLARLMQQAAPKDPQDVIYAQLNHLALRREPAVAFSPEELPENHSVYASLAIH